ncbi:MAG: low molecular weight protein-tyrosine-phosphatase [Corynebacterium sp.]|nr:low molecular weight protein-tyrosine-phosphatase [Corynebacterium sp.]
MSSSQPQAPKAPLLHIVVVCTGNICRSPMAHVVLQSAIEDAGFERKVQVSSCGTGGWHVGQQADSRALSELRRAGFDGSWHRAAQLGPEHVGADLYLALDQGHARSLKRSGISEQHIRLVRSFDPKAQSKDVPDPYYGSQEDFGVALSQIEAAIPGIMQWISQELERTDDQDAD